MKKLLKLEEAAMLLLGIWWFSLLPFAWWWFPLLLLAPDISMLGYLAGNKVGAYVYNFFHHKALAVLVLLAGIYLKDGNLQLAGIILWSHAAMDRLFGYGLKTLRGFAYTHLGKIGKDQ